MECSEPSEVPEDVWSASEEVELSEYPPLGLASTLSEERGKPLAEEASWAGDFPEVGSEEGSASTEPGYEATSLGMTGKAGRRDSAGRRWRSDNASGGHSRLLLRSAAKTEKQENLILSKAGSMEMREA